jgi:uroporphyrinogen-III synthase
VAIRHFPLKRQQRLSDRDNRARVCLLLPRFAAFMLTLDGRRIALLERRHSQELAALVSRLGGIPITVPAMDEVACHDDFNTFFDGLAGRRFSIAIFLNGAGVVRLLAEAERRRHLAATVRALREMTIVTRGAKPIAVLERHGLKPQVTTTRPHTTVELKIALSSLDLHDRGVVLVHYGERNRSIADAVRDRGARLREICPYEWILPDDLGPLTALIRALIAHKLDAVLFTNQVQCRHLFQVAADLSQAQGLVLSLNMQAVVGAVGPVCASALRRAGVIPDVIPRAPNMQSLIDAVAEYFASSVPEEPYTPASILVS